VGSFPSAASFFCSTPFPPHSPLTSLTVFASTTPHYRDYSTPVDEIMRGLHRHVLSGEILYPAVSDTPAWVVATANAYARQHGYSPFVLYQGLWNVSVRDVEREILRECSRPEPLLLYLQIKCWL
jgi:aryl-alcohol dehydrogenase-like predicted oxidoreductase